MTSTKSTTARKAAPKTPAKAPATKAVATKATKAQPAPAPAKPERAPRPNAERRNETSHQDGRTAVMTFPCSACGRPAGVYCQAKDGRDTKHVHSDRMKALDALTPAALAKATKAMGDRMPTALPAKATKAPATKARRAGRAA
jgi:hypothetical protein